MSKRCLHLLALAFLLPFQAPAAESRLLFTQGVGGPTATFSGFGSTLFAVFEDGTVIHWNGESLMSDNSYVKSCLTGKELGFLRQQIAALSELEEHYHMSKGTDLMSQSFCSLVGNGGDCAYVYGRVIPPARENQFPTKNLRDVYTGQAYPKVLLRLEDFIGRYSPKDPVAWHPRPTDLMEPPRGNFRDHITVQSGNCRLTHPPNAE